MRSSSWAVLLALPAFAFGSTAFSAAAAGVPETSVPAARLISGTHDLGRANPKMPMSVTVMLAYRHAGELERLLEAQSDSSSPDFRHFLTRAQFDAYFSPAAGDYAGVAAALRANGFRIASTTPNRLLIRAAGTVGTVERLFRTEMHVVSQAGYGNRLANARPARMPDSFAGTAFGVVGLDSVIRVGVDHRLGRQGSLVSPESPHLGLLFGPDGGYGPLAYQKAYGFPSSSVTTGSGQGAAVAIDADFLDSDLSSFLSYFNIARTGPTTRVLVDGGPPSGLTNDSVETTLDTETIAGLAPGVKLYVYEMPTLEDQNIIDTYNKVVTDDEVGPVNSSFGGCDATDPTLSQMSDAIAIQGAALGITFHASSGDGGAFACPSVGVSSPASAPHFVAVGGTSLYEDPLSAKVVHEFAWDGSGGGFSSVWPMPNYQKGLGTTTPGGRNVPDLAFDADPDTGTSLYYGGAFAGPEGGTSLASPIFDAGLTIANALTNSHAGFVNPSIYKLYKTEGTSHAGKLLFRDITVGSNFFYSAGVGYDDVTGLGALDFTNTSAALK